MSEKKEVKPEKKFRAGGVSATVWKNQAKNKEGKEYDFFTVGVERSYKDKKDEWQKTSSMMVNDLPKVILVAQKAYDFVTSSPEKGTKEE